MTPPRAVRSSGATTLLVLLALVAGGAGPVFAQGPPKPHEGQPLSEALSDLPWGKWTG